MSGVDEQPPGAGAPPVSLIRRLFEERRRAARAAAAGRVRTGPQLVRDAYRSWGLEPPPQIRAAAEAADAADLADQGTAGQDDVPPGQAAS